MNFTDVISMLGAIATFLFGMSIMTDGLEKLSSGRLERILERLTSNVFKGVLLGALVTGLIQSSAATTVMCVGFVNAGVMKLRQTVGIIMGANIGTTVTAQLLALGDISSDNILMLLLKPSSLGPILAVVGIVLYLFLKGGRRQIVGQIALGLGLLFIGMNTLERALAPLQALPEFQELFVAFSNPLLGILMGALVTALIQSSSASVGILQAMSSTGVVTFNIAFPLIMGQNIGTCVTALISSVGASKNAKRTACIHLLFNVIGSLFFLILLYTANAIFHFSFWTSIMDRGSIANLHLAFNVSCTVLLLPFHKLLVTLAEKIIPGDAEQRELSMLDERFLATPSVALDKAHESTVQMSYFVLDNYRAARSLLQQWDARKAERLNETEVTIDKLQDMLDNYLIRLSGPSLSPEDSNKISELLHAVSDFERIGDYAVNLSECALYLHEHNQSLSETARKELELISDAVEEAIVRTINCYDHRTREEALQVEPLEEVVDLIHKELERRHIERLKQGACTAELGAQFLELLINLERISDHCSNIALCILRETSPSNSLVRIDSHAYLYHLHHNQDQAFDTLFLQFRDKYYARIPEDYT